ncbi:MAG: OB-fold domain-containing protein [Desulfomonilaceae bacterium]|nr:OB-fold domain-containing protein [Desulfomonilaceae bacterium]
MTSKPKKIAEGLFHLPAGNPAEGYLIGARCAKCGLVVFPRRVVCPGCLDRESMEETALSKHGTLYSFSVNQVAPDGFTAPYITGKVDLPEKVRIFAVITGCEATEDALSIGMDMQMVFEAVGRDAAGNELIGYAFRPAEQH